MLAGPPVPRFSGRDADTKNHKRMDKHQAACVWYAVFIVIGLSCWLLGCNTQLYGQCPSRRVLHGVVVDTFVETEQCTERNGRVPRTYDGYDAYARYGYGDNQTCLYVVLSEQESRAKAEASLTKYDPGDTATLLLRRGESRYCITAGEGMNTWIAGNALLSFCALVCACLIAVYACVAVSEYHDRRARLPSEQAAPPHKDVEFVEIDASGDESIEV